MFKFADQLLKLRGGLMTYELIGTVQA